MALCRRGRRRGRQSFRHQMVHLRKQTDPSQPPTRPPPSPDRQFYPTPLLRSAWHTTQTNVDLVRTDQFNQRGPNDNRVDAVRLADDFHPLGSGGIECGVANTCQRGREGARVSRARESVRDRQPVAVTRRERHAELGVHNG
eukprot:1995951-Prymnesium_polylepis.1